MKKYAMKKLSKDMLSVGNNRNSKSEGILDVEFHDFIVSFVIFIFISCRVISSFRWDANIFAVTKGRIHYSLLLILSH